MSAGHIVVEISDLGAARLSDECSSKEEAERRAEERNELAEKYSLPFVYRVKEAS